MKKRILKILLFILGVSLFADPWINYGDTEVMTTIGRDRKNRMYICEWIHSKNYNGVSFHIQTSGSFHFGRIRSGCVIVGDYVFPAEMQDGFYDNSVLMRLNKKILEHIEQDTVVIVKVDSYTIYTEINNSRGVDYE